MAFCPACGEPRQPDDRYCPQCGRSHGPAAPADQPPARPTEPPPPPAAEPPAGPAECSDSPSAAFLPPAHPNPNPGPTPPPAPPAPGTPNLLSPGYPGDYPYAPAPESNILPLGRILALTFASYGTYLFYWFYLTWQQYKKHTGAEAYPVWHALTLVVPIYAWFRLHAHAKAVQTLNRQAGLSPDAVIPILPVLFFLFSNGLFGVSDYLLPLPREGQTLRAGLTGFFLIQAAMAFVYFLISHLQRPLNDYWQQVEPPGRPVRQLPRPGEVVFVLIGLLYWLGSFYSLAVLAAR